MIPLVVASERGLAQTSHVTACLGLKDWNVEEDNEEEDSGKCCDRG